MTFNIHSTAKPLNLRVFRAKQKLLQKSGLYAHIRNLAFDCKNRANRPHYRHQYPIILLPLAIYVAQLVEALSYKSEGRGFGSRWCHWNFLLT